MADIREQDLDLKTAISDTDWMRLVTPTGNHRMTVGQFKDLIGYTQAKSDISQLQSDVTSLKTVTTTTAYTNQNGWVGTLTLSRHGDLVTIKGDISKTGTTTNGTQLAVIPAGFRPVITTPIAAAKGNTSPYNSSFLFWLYANGNLAIQTTETVEAERTGANLYINQVYSV